MGAHVAHEDAEVRLLAAVADPVRLAILRELAAAGEVCGCDFDVLGTVTQPTLSHHLRILREAGLVTFTRRGVNLLYRVDRSGMTRLADVVHGLLPATPAAQPAPRDCCRGTSRT